MFTYSERNGVCRYVYIFLNKLSMSLCLHILKETFYVVMFTYSIRDVVSLYVCIF